MTHDEHKEYASLVRKAERTGELTPEEYRKWRRLWLLQKDS